MAKVVKGVVKAVVGVVKGVVKGIGMVLGLVKPKINATNQATNQRLSKRLEPEDFRKIIFGETAGASDMRFWEVHGAPDYDQYDEVLAVAGHEIESYGDLYIEEELVPFSGNNATGTYAGALSRAQHLGNDGGAAISVGAGTYWDATSKFTGCAHYALKWTISEEKLPNGVPSRYTQVIKGAKVYDPRKDGTRGGSGSHRADDQSTWDYATLDSNGVPIGRNNALQMLWYLIGWRVDERDSGGVLTGEKVLIAGRGVDLDDIDFASFIAAANDAEAEEHYTDMILSTGDDHSKNEAIIACDGLLGEILDTGGLWSYRVTLDDTATLAATFNDDDIVADVTWDPEASVSDKYNRVVGTFIDPSANSLYQSRPYPHVKDTSYETSDGYKKRKTQNFQAIQDDELAQKAARVMLNRGRFTGQFHAIFQMRALKAQTWDCVTLSLEHYGWVDKLFRVVEQAITAEGIEMVLREEHSSIYTGGTIVVPPAPGTVAKYNPRQQIALNGLGAVTGDRSAPNGTTEDGLAVNWTVPPGNVRRTEVQYKRTADSYWTGAATNSSSVTDIFVSPLLPNTEYQVRARHVSIHEIPGAWSTVTVTTSSATQAPAEGIFYDIGGSPIAVADLQPDEAGANVTGDHEAATIAGQGALATASSANWATQIESRPVELTDGRIIAGLDSSGDLSRAIPGSIRDSSNLLGYTGGALFVGELDADLTSVHEAATIAGQGALATSSLVETGVDNTEVSIDGRGRLVNAGGGYTTLGANLLINPDMLEDASGDPDGYKLRAGHTFVRAGDDDFGIGAQPFNWVHCDDSPTNWVDTPSQADSNNRFSVTPDEELVFAIYVYSDSADGVVQFQYRGYDTSGAATNNLQVITVGVANTWVLVQKTIVTNSDDFEASVRVRGSNANGGTFTGISKWYLGRVEPGSTRGAVLDSNLLESPGGILATLSNFRTDLGQAATLAGQGYFATGTDWSNLSGATLPEDNADVTASAQATLNGLTNLTINADHTGTVNSGELPANIKVTRKKGDTDVSATTTWDIDDSSGVTATINSTGVVNITACTSSGYIVVESVRDTVTLLFTIAISKVNAEPPSTGGGSGGTTVSDTSLTGVASTTLTAVSDEMTVQTGDDGDLTFSGSISCNSGSVAPTGSFETALRWRWKAVGGSWAYVAAETVSDPDATTFDDGEYIFSIPGTNTCNTSKTTGLSANTDYVVQLMGRRTSASPTKTVNFSGTASCTGS